MRVTKILAATGLVCLFTIPLATAEDHPMGFFITSSGVGQGGNLGGLKGADSHCTTLADAAGSKGRTWRAY